MMLAVATKKANELQEGDIIMWGKDNFTIVCKVQTGEKTTRLGFIDKNKQIHIRSRRNTTQFKIVV